jgi:hemerythrin-like domain-containing protein
MLEILKVVSSRLVNKDYVKPEHLLQIVEFIQVFADKCHHGKEENLLFRSMVKAGLPKEGGPIAVMLSEHEMGRNFVRKMDEAVSAVTAVGTRPSESGAMPSCAK